MSWLCVAMPLGNAYSAPGTVPIPDYTPPKKAERPMAIPTPTAPELFGCDRTVSYRGRSVLCDSYTRPDGERLRPLIDSVPAALSELDAYQKSRRSLRNSAYVASTGFAIFLASLFFRVDGKPNAAGYAGLGIMGASVVYGFVSYQTAERRLENAIQRYNEARPNDMIKLEVTTEFSL